MSSRYYGRRRSQRQVTRESEAREPIRERYGVPGWKPLPPATSARELLQRIIERVGVVERWSPRCAARDAAARPVAPGDERAAAWSVLGALWAEHGRVLQRHGLRVEWTAQVQMRLDRHARLVAGVRVIDWDSWEQTMSHAKMCETLAKIINNWGEEGVEQ